MTQAKESTWEEINRPLGPQPIPTWCRGAHVDWMDGYGNPPTVLVKAVGMDWPDQRFRKVGKRYIAEHPDGRGKMHVHDGAIAMNPVKMFRREDGTFHRERRFDATIWPNCQFGAEPGEWCETPMLSTTQQEGYAKRHIWITLDDGRDLILRGPWHCGAPPGHISITTVDMDYARRSGRPSSPWWRNLGCFGTALREDVYIAVLSRFLPHLPLAKVSYSYGGNGIEPFKPEWGEPKHFWLERQRAARAA